MRTNYQSRNESLLKKIKSVPIYGTVALEEQSPDFR